jgi:hypothetical protein
VELRRAAYWRSSCDLRNSGGLKEGGWVDGYLWIGYRGPSSDGAGVVAVATDAYLHWCIESSLRDLRRGCSDCNRGRIRGGIWETAIVGKKYQIDCHTTHNNNG